MWAKILLSSFLVFYVIEQIQGLNYNDVCILNPDDCDLNQYLVCVEVLAGRFHCRCDSTTFEHPPGTCVKYAEFPSTPCIEGTEQCKNVPGTACSKDHLEDIFKCLCVEEQNYFEFPLGLQCSKFTENLLDECQLGNGARFCEKIEGSICSEDAGQVTRCMCDGDYFQHPHELECVRFATSPGEQCFDGTNQCKDVEGTACEETTDGFACKCQEAQNYFEYPLGVQCSKFATNLHDPCVIGTRFCDKLQGTFCTESDGGGGPKCECDESKEFFEHPDGLQCVPYAKFPGDVCIPGTEHCKLVTGSECPDDEQVCTCTGDYFEYPLDTACSKYATALHDWCDVEASFCEQLEGTSCMSKPNNASSCECDESKDYFEHELTCKKFSKFPGDDCIVGTEQCKQIEGADCEENKAKCKCQDDQDYFEFPLGVSCTKYAVDLQDPCVNGPGAFFCNKIPGAKCLDDKCECDEGNDYFEHNRNCLIYASELGEECEQNSKQCDKVFAAECRPLNGSFQCACRDGYFEEPTLNECLTLPSRPYDPCRTNEHCDDVPNTDCSCYEDSQTCSCECIEDWDLSKDKLFCIPRATLIGQPCETSAQCRNLDNTTCALQSDGSYQCVCLHAGLVPSSDLRFCLEVVDTIGDECEESIQCETRLGENSVCSMGICQCKNGFVSNGNRNRCLKHANIGEECLEEIQCTDHLGDQSYCTINVCRCKPGSNYLNTKCHVVIPLNGTCDADEQCILGTNELASCRWSTCVCNPGTIPDRGSCYAYKWIGEPCSSRDECDVPIEGDAYCKNGYCSCFEGEAPNRLGTKCEGVLQQGSLFYILILSSVFLFL